MTANPPLPSGGTRERILAALAQEDGTRRVYVRGGPIDVLCLVDELRAALASPAERGTTPPMDERAIGELVRLAAAKTNYELESPFDFAMKVGQLAVTMALEAAPAVGGTGPRGVDAWTDELFELMTNRETSEWDRKQKTWLRIRTVLLAFKANLESQPPSLGTDATPGLDLAQRVAREQLGFECVKATEAVESALGFFETYDDNEAWVAACQRLRTAVNWRLDVSAELTALRAARSESPAETIERCAKVCDVLQRKAEDEAKQEIDEIDAEGYTDAAHAYSIAASCIRSLASATTEKET